MAELGTTWRGSRLRRTPRRATSSSVTPALYASADARRQKRFARPFEPIGELVAMALDVLVDSPFDELGLLEPGHAGRVRTLSFVDF